MDKQDTIEVLAPVVKALNRIADALEAIVTDPPTTASSTKFKMFDKSRTA